MRRVSGEKQTRGVSRIRDGATRCPCRIDHLIPLELGGSNDIKNLWTESYETQPWNATVKDAIENRLHDLVCDGSISPEQAQHEIATDWTAAYLKYVGHPPSGF